MKTHTSPTPGELIDESEAAATLGCAITTLRNWRYTKQGPRFVKVGKRMVRYQRTDLAAFVGGGASSSAP